MQDAKRFYRLSAEFERAVATLAATSREFYARVGSSIDPEMFKTPDARVLVGAAQAVARDLGQGAEGTLLVVQRLYRHMDEGRLKWGELESAAMYMDAAFEAGLPAVDNAVTELRPILQGAMRNEAVRTALDEFGKGGDFTRTVELVNKAATVGLTRDTAGSRFGMGSFDEIRKMRDADKLPTGVDDIDLQLGGGAARGQVSLVTADTGVGKSLWLSQCYAVALMRGMHCGYATLELPTPTVDARTIAAMTSVPIDEVMLESPLAVQRLEQLLPELGRGWTQKFAPGATTVADLERWVAECEQQEGRPMDLVVVDYMDKLVAPKSDLTSYETGRQVTEALRKLAGTEGSERWFWTASQPKERKNPKALIDVGDLADSRNKGRLINLMLSANPKLREDGGVEILWYIGKNTTGVSAVKVGPLPHERHLGRIAPVRTLSARWQPDIYEGL